MHAYIVVIRTSGGAYKVTGFNQRQPAQDFLKAQLQRSAVIDGMVFPT